MKIQSKGLKKIYWFYLFLLLNTISYYSKGNVVIDSLSSPLTETSLTKSEKIGEQINALIDSLSLSQNEIEKSKLSLKIAWLLKDNDWKRCLTYMDSAELNADESNNSNFTTKTYKEIADLYYSKDFLDIALQYYVKAYNIVKTKKDNHIVFSLENDIAIISARLNQKDKALYFFKKIYQYHLRKKDSLNIAKVFNNMGMLFLEDQPDSSIVYFLESIKIAKYLKDSTLCTYLNANLGRCYLLKNSSKSKFYFRKALKMSETINPEIKAWIYQIVADYYLKNNQPDSSLIYSNKSLSILRNNKYSFIYKDVAEITYKSYLAKEDYQNATRYFVIYDNVRDSLNIEQKAVNVEKIKLEQEYLIREQKRDFEESKQRNKYLIMAFLLILISLILLIILIRYKNRLRESKLEKELIQAKEKELNLKLESKNKTLIAKAMQEIHRSELIQGILEDLKEIKVKAVKKETELAINIIQKRLAKDTNNNIWDEFELSFDQVHETFYKNLQERHPVLTSKDRRLCALLVLDLSSKEIAQITGQDYKSVENARTRLRKKLDLTNTKSDLTAYLNSLK